jgi:hypothetical protein
MMLDTVDARIPAAWGDLRLLLLDGVVAAQTMFGDHPHVGFGSPRPVLLLETRETFMVKGPGGAAQVELQVELLRLLGFQRLTGARVPDPLPLPDPLPGWSVAAGPAWLELRDPEGDPWVIAETSPDPTWAAAAAGGGIIVLFGPCLGVRPPRGVPQTQYLAGQRAAELRMGIAHGLVAAALIG